MTAMLADQLGIDLDEAERRKLELARAGLVAGTSRHDDSPTTADPTTDLTTQSASSPTYGGRAWSAADANDDWAPEADVDAGVEPTEPAYDGRWSRAGADDQWLPDATTDASGEPTEPPRQGGGWPPAEAHDDRQPPVDAPRWSQAHETAQIPLRDDAGTTAGGQVDAEDDAADIVRDQTRRLIDEIKGSLDYCATQQDIPSIQRVVLTGGASQWPGLAEALANELGLDITAGSPLQMVGNGKGSGLGADELAATGPHLAVAVGLALGAQQ
jgi:hypothetical protein